MKSTNSKLTKLINKLSMIKTKEVYEAMLSVDRGEFCDNEGVYEDCPQPIGYNATISAPHMHAYALEYMRDHLATAERVLDVGSGSGYLCAAMFFMMKNPKAQVFGIEHISQLVTQSIKNLSKSHQKLLDEGRIVIKEGDGRLGLAEFAPYDCIHVGAAASEMPSALIDQLAKGGRMLIPVGVFDQSFQLVDKDMNGKVTIKDLLGVVC